MFISRRDLILALVGVDKSGKLSDHVGGITRLQKLLFLLEREGGLTPSGEGFEFTPYRHGPYSSKLYDDLEFLENLGLLESEVVAESTTQEAAELDHITFDSLLGEEPDPRAADSHEERRYRLSEGGLARVQEMLASGDSAPVADAIRQIKSKFGAHSLSDLLHYVYTRYPETTTESVIKEKVLSWRPKKKR